MKCSVCKEQGHNKRTCKKINEPDITSTRENVNNTIENTECNRNEVQGHGFYWEKEILMNIYGLSNEEINGIKYTSKMDLPSNLNRIDNCDISIKTSSNLNRVYMADCLRVFDEVSREQPMHMIVIHYNQNVLKKIKKIICITEVNLTNSCELLFGSITRHELEELDKAVKSIPQKRKPTKEEYIKLYSLRDSLQKKSGAIHLDIKCNSTQSRLQCSFNRFKDFIEKNKERVIAKSNTHIFRNGSISSEISSGCRVFKPKNEV